MNQVPASLCVTFKCCLLRHDPLGPLPCNHDLHPPLHSFSSTTHHHHHHQYFFNTSRIPQLIHSNIAHSALHHLLKLNTSLNQTTIGSLLFPQIRLSKLSPTFSSPLVLQPNGPPLLYPSRNRSLIKGLETPFSSASFISILASLFFQIHFSVHLTDLSLVNRNNVSYSIVSTLCARQRTRHLFLVRPLPPTPKLRSRLQNTQSSNKDLIQTEEFTCRSGRRI